MHLNNRADFADFKAVEQIFEDQSRHCHLKRQQLHWALHGENMGPGGVSPVAGIALGCVGGVWVQTQHAPARSVGYLADRMVLSSAKSRK
jgi:hypothetical protein